MYGLYMRSHTVDSLATELSHAFSIVECKYEEYDPRYVMCVVERKGDSLTIVGDSHAIGEIDPFQEDFHPSGFGVIDQQPSMAAMLHDVQQTGLDGAENFGWKFGAGIGEIDFTIIGHRHIVSKTYRCTVYRNRQCVDTPVGADG